MAVQQSQPTPAGAREGREPGAGRVLRGLLHGGHVLTETGEGAEALAHEQEAITTAAAAGLERAVQSTSRFDYLFGDLAAAWPDRHLPNDDPEKTVADLKVLGGAMVEDPPLVADPLQPSSNSTIPAIYTYWGQFIDHDMTANTDRDSSVSDITRSPFVPLEPGFVADNLGNLRHPALNLDSLYGDGPGFGSAAPTDAASFYDGIKLKLGRVALEPADEIPGDPIVAAEDREHDLPRIGSTADVGDGRNDENLIVAQFHVAFLRFHNAVVDWVRATESGYADDEAVFARARQLVQWHYQWLVVHDYLKTVTLTGATDQALLAAGDQQLLGRRDGCLYMPLEYSVAVYRFGHTMVRAVYDYNRNFGRPGTNVLPSAPFSFLFQFTGKANPPFRGATDVLPFNWVIEWDRMVDKHDSRPDHFARKIDTRLAFPMRDLANEGNAADVTPPVKQILKRLATRNLLRGYLLGIPTGQAVAEAMGVTPLTEEELRQDNTVLVNEALEAGGFLERTPLWYYVLKEAEIRANGNSLGEMGSRIVCETIVGQLRLDPTSYLNAPGGWTPAAGVKLPNGDAIVSIRGLLQFAGVLA